jgi:hypothetical protein
MTETLVDKVMMVIVPITDVSEFTKLLEAMQQKMTQSADKMGQEAGKKVAKGFFGNFESGFKKLKANWGKLAVAGAGIVMGLNNAQDKTIQNLQTQIDLADQLGTTASKIGMSNEDFSRLYTVLRQGDTSSESAIQTIKEFSKRLGEFKMTGAKSELFSGIQNQDNVAKAFLEATAIVNQEQDPTKRASMIDQMFGGQGNEQLAEFFTKDIVDLIKQSKNINYTEYGKAITSLSEQDDIIKANRLRLERENMVKTAILTQGRGGELIAGQESFLQQQLLQSTSVQRMEAIEGATEAIKVAGNAFVEGAGNLISVFGKLGDSADKASKNLDNMNSKSEKNTYVAD